jgi:hypothetical protein
MDHVNFKTRVQILFAFFSTIHHFEMINFRNIFMKQKLFLLLALFSSLTMFYSCSSDKGYGGYYDYTVTDDVSGVIKLKKKGATYVGEMMSYQIGDLPMKNIHVSGNKITCEVKIFGEERILQGTFVKDSLIAYLFRGKDSITLLAGRQNYEYLPSKHSGVTYTLSNTSLADYENNIDHLDLIKSFDAEGFKRGGKIFNSNCLNCHGNPEVEGSIPMSLKFWKQPFKAGNDPFSMYQTITKGYASMPPLVNLTPQEKYDVILYIREKFVRPNNNEQYFKVGPEYLAQLPKGTTTGPPIKPYQPWSDMDYGNFFINTYELADLATGLPRYHSPEPVPYADENYLKNNFAYKGIAIRLDKGPGGVSRGKAWMVFDHDLMRVAGGWTGTGFIDWQGILLNDTHETHPRNIGQMHFQTLGGPAWADPATGSFNDQRFLARDGRRFGPLPKKWADYKGLYYNGDRVIISYSVGNSNVLEMLGVEKSGDKTVFTRTLNISPSSTSLKTRVANAGTNVALSGSGGILKNEDGFQTLEILKGSPATIKLFIADSSVNGLTDFARKSASPESLSKYTSGGAPHYPQALVSTVIAGNENGPIAVDDLIIPFDNPWKCRMRLSGIDFFKNPNKGALCTTDGDIWTVEGLTDKSGKLIWKRIGSGLFQPLGIKVIGEKIYVTCRDQIVLLHDLNADGETDYYESFNHDSQVTDHFHEFAMGLQTDKEGNFYYAKSGRHAREALVPQHGTLIKVSKDGSKSEIIASGFRAANGVCINPDGSFIVTDQQGFWNPMNRVNWVEGKNKFYGNMWGYNPPKDSSSAAMVPPILWIDMEFDRSPSELVWVDSKKWGPLDGSLLSFSYGFGKVQMVLTEKVHNQRQAAVVDLPGVKFRSGVMRGRFNPGDGNLYACGMSAWGTLQVTRSGEFCRLRYTGKKLSIPVKLHNWEDGVELVFTVKLNSSLTAKLENFKVQTWDILRSRDYGSQRYNTQTLKITGIKMGVDGKSVKLMISRIKPVDIMTIAYSVTDESGNQYKEKIQSTIYNLRRNN